MNTDIDKEIKNKERTRYFIGYKIRSRHPLGYCDNCGQPIFKTDKNNEPYRLCFLCSNKN